MKYTITPFGLSVAAAVLYALYSLFITPSAERANLALVMVGFLVPTLVLVMGADYLIQKYISKLWITYAIQLTIIALWGAYLLWGKPQRTVVMPEAFEGKFIAIVFGIDGTPKLPTGRSFEVKIPAHGILLTSDTESESKIYAVNQLKNSAGVEIEFLTMEAEWIRDEVDSIEKNGRQYYYVGWTHRTLLGVPDRGKALKEELLRQAIPE